MKKLKLILLAMGCTLMTQAMKVDFIRDVKPVLEFNCVSCHQETKAKGKLRIDTHEQLLKGADGEPVIVPGNAKESSFYYTTILDADDDDVMPPTDYMHVMSKHETEIIKNWINQGAKWPKGEVLKAQKRQLPEKVDFNKYIKPIMEYNCISCHGPTKDKGDLRLDTKEWAFKGPKDEHCIVPGKPLESTFYTLMLLTEENDEDDMMMPPAKAKEKGQVVTYQEIALVRKWIEQGAHFPEDAKLLPKKRPKAGPKKPVIMATAVYKKLGFDKLAGKTQAMKDYKSTIPGTDVAYEMVAIKAGKYTRGGTKENEMPKKEISIDAFWMQKFETSWAQYELWQFNREIELRKKDYKITDGDKVADLISRPTPPFLDMSFGMGKKNRPVTGATQVAAKFFAMWLSAKTGHFYRLPTEAEWEYACRAGTKTKYYFGDDASKLKEYAWFYDNTDGDGYKERGKLKPNAWGLYDMHGNVSEWVLDTFTTDFYKKGAVKNPLNEPPPAGDLNPVVEAKWPTKLYERIVRGGNWNDDPPELRSAARLMSEIAWKERDPQYPKSVWYHTNASMIGFRLVRPDKVPALKDLHKYWPSDAEIKAIPNR